MKRCLVDVNVGLALLVRQHTHHALAVQWFDTLAEGGAGLCRPVQLGLIRLLNNRSVMGHDVISAFAAWSLIQELLTDERLELVSEPPEIDSILPAFFNYAVPTAKLVGDAYLAAFAIRSARSLVTLDRGFLQFDGLSVDLLA